MLNAYFIKDKALRRRVTLLKDYSELLIYIYVKGYEYSKFGANRYNHHYNFTSKPMFKEAWRRGSNDGAVDFKTENKTYG